MITDKNKKFLAKFGSSDHIDKLMNDKDSDVRYHIAKHSNLKDHHIDKLMNDKDRYVRTNIARHPLYKKMKAEGKI